MFSGCIEVDIGWKWVNKNILSKSWDIFDQKQNTNEVFQSEKKEPHSRDTTLTDAVD